MYELDGIANAKDNISVICMPHTCSTGEHMCLCAQNQAIAALTKPPPKPKKKSLQQLFAGVPKQATKKVSR